MITKEMPLISMAEMLIKFIEKADERLDVVKLTDEQGNDLSKLHVHITFDKSINYPKRRI